MAPVHLELLRQAALSWRQAEDRVIGSSTGTLPWMVLYDTTCTWHVAPADTSLDTPRVDVGLAFRGNPVDVRATPHGDMVRLPTGDSLPPQPLAYTTLVDDGETPLVIFAMPDVWAQHPGFATDEAQAEIPTFWKGVLAHELVHTRQLAPVARRLEELQNSSDLPENMDDDIIQTRFGEDPEFRAAMLQEIQQWHRAASEPGRSAQRDLARQALSMANERRARFFRDDNEVYLEVEDLFLALEGAASWAAFLQTNTQRLRSEDATQILSEYDPMNTAWVQAYGLLIYAVLDRFVPNWAQRSFGRLPASPFELLLNAL
jgi:hypothetical protein